MEWVVVECLACPVTGTFFSCVISHENEWVILWSGGDELMLPGDGIQLMEGGFYFGKESEPMLIFTVTPFRAGFWKRLQSSTRCPGECRVKPQQCTHPGRCFFTRCPYGLKKVES
jgi:hypothetical protein